MRTLKLREHQAVPCRLTRAELGLLLNARTANGSSILSVGLRDPVEGVYEVRASSIVGTLVWPGLQVLIRPKVDLQNIFFLLGFRGELAKWDDEQFLYEQEPDFLRALAWAFDAEVRRGLRHGIARDYLTVEETLTAIRGRIDIGRQVSIRQGRALPLECRYQDYSEDITMNRMIKSAQRRLSMIAGLGQGIERRLRHGSSAFAGVSDVEFLAASVPDVLFTRLNRQWEPATRLAQMILRQEALKDETGAAIGSSFTVDMNVLFEKFIEEIVREQAIRAGLRLVPQAQVPLTASIGMRPDLVLESDRRPLAVGDAKYVGLEASGWPLANLYQLLAYCVALGLPRGLLIYASPRPLEAHKVRNTSIELEIVGVDMSLAPMGLLEQARAAARRLVAHAEACGLATL